jgi:DNA-binding transcriptional ArsR family regulator
MNMDFDQRIEDLERRVGALESGPRPGGAAQLTPQGDLARIEDLRRRQGPRYVRGEARGAVTYSGALALGDRESLWAREHGVPEILDLDPARLARVLAALGHPVRLKLAYSLVEKPRTSQELQEVIGSASAGQLYHHLKEMIAAGVVAQEGRSRYLVTGERIVPLLAILAAAGDLAPHESGDADASPDPSPHQEV